MRVCKIDANNPLPTHFSLGRQGENLVTQIRFDISAWVARFGDGTAQLIAQRDGDPAPYPVAVTREGSEVVWDVSKSDTAAAGYGKAELQFFVGERLAKSETFSTYVEDALGPATEDPPEPYQSWVDDVLQAGTDAQDAAERAEASLDKQPYPNAETGTWWRWNSATGEWEDTGASYAASDTFVHNQSPASDTWTITHNLGKYPSVSVVDSAGTLVVGSVRYLDENTLVVTFASAFSGKAFLN